MIINQFSTDIKRRKETKKTEEGVPFCTEVGVRGHYVQLTLYNAERIKEYPGMKLTVQWPGQTKKEVIYGHPDEELLRMFAKKGKQIETVSTHL